MARGLPNTTRRGRGVTKFTMRQHRERKQWRQVSTEMRESALRVEQLVREVASEHVGVKPGVSRTGRITLRCTLCNKVIYKTQADAEKAVEKIPDPMTAYWDSRCGWWHLATVRA